jgi:holo-[acyl-carrier protein] synthase
MIIGIGIDIVKIDRIANLLSKFGNKFEQRILTANEIINSSQISNPKKKESYCAKRFVAKEAFSKAIGLGIGRGVGFTDIEIINDKNGKPKIKLTTSSKQFLQKHLNQNNFKIDLSIADESDVAQAIVVISSCKT